MNNAQGNNSFRAIAPGNSHGLRQLDQLFGDNVETIFIDHGHDDDTTGNAGLHITQVFPTASSHANNFFFNNPGHYNISWGNDISSGRPQAHLGQLTRMPTTSVSITPTSAGSFGVVGTGAAAGTSVQNRGGSTSANSNANWERDNRSTSTSSSTERPAFARASLPATYNGIGERGNGTTSPSLTERPAFARASLPTTLNEQRTGK